MDRHHAPWDAGGIGPIRRRPSTQTQPHRDTGPRLSILRGGHRSSSVTAVAADDAIQRFLYIKCLARVGRGVEPHEGHHPSAAAAVLSLPAVPWPEFPTNPWFARGLMVGVLMTALVALAAIAIPARISEHSVAGVVLVGRQPLVQGRIVFHPAHAGAERRPLGYQTGRDGSFHSDERQGIPDGLYVIVVESGSAAVGIGGGRALIPPIYRDVATTPLRVHVTEDLSGLRLMIRK
jgi:hypothetical protein